jgi:hypothetical protein
MRARDSLELLLRETPLVPVGAGIALGWSLYRVANELGTLVVSLTVRFDRGAFAGSDGALDVRIGDRFVNFAPLVQNLLTFAVVLAVVLYALARTRRA